MENLKSKSKIVIYDLDGTLVDSMPGISLSFRHTMKQLGLPEPTDEEIRRAIGPGLHAALEYLLGTHDKDEISKAVAIYRQHHDSEGYKSTTFYADILDLVQELNSLKVPQYVASMKADTAVKPILKHLGALDFFVDAIGSSPVGATKSKTEMLHFLADKHKFSLADAILVGDSEHDARAALNANVKFFGVTFGYGTREEINSVKWGEVFDSVAELRSALLRAVKS